MLMKRDDSSIDSLEHDMYHMDFESHHDRNHQRHLHTAANLTSPTNLSRDSGLTMSDTQLYTTEEGVDSETSHSSYNNSSPGQDDDDDDHQPASSLLSKSVSNLDAPPENMDLCDDIDQIFNGFLRRSSRRRFDSESGTNSSDHLHDCQRSSGRRRQQHLGKVSRQEHFSRSLPPPSTSHQSDDSGSCGDNEGEVEETLRCSVRSVKRSNMGMLNRSASGEHLYLDSGGRSRPPSLSLVKQPDSPEQPLSPLSPPDVSKPSYFHRDAEMRRPTKKRASSPSSSCSSITLHHRERRKHSQSDSTSKTITITPTNSFSESPRTPKVLTPSTLTPSNSFSDHFHGGTMMYRTPEPAPASTRTIIITPAGLEGDGASTRIQIRRSLSESSIGSDGMATGCSPMSTSPQSRSSEHSPCSNHEPSSSSSSLQQPAADRLALQDLPIFNTLKSQEKQQRYSHQRRNNHNHNNNNHNNTNNHHLTLSLNGEVVVPPGYDETLERQHHLMGWPVAECEHQHMNPTDKAMSIMKARLMYEDSIRRYNAEVSRKNARLERMQHAAEGATSTSDGKVHVKVHYHPPSVRQQAREMEQPHHGHHHHHRHNKPRHHQPPQPHDHHLHPHYQVLQPGGRHLTPEVNWSVKELRTLFSPGMEPVSSVSRSNSTCSSINSRRSLYSDHQLYLHQNQLPPPPQFTDMPSSPSQPHSSSLLQPTNSSYSCANTAQFPFPHPKLNPPTSMFPPPPPSMSSSSTLPRSLGGIDLKSRALYNEESYV